MYRRLCVYEAVCIGGCSVYRRQFCVEMLDLLCV